MPDASKLSTEELKKLALSLHDAIYITNCFAVHDLREYDWALAELRKRGIEPVETSVLNFEEQESENSEV